MEMSVATHDKAFLDRMMAECTRTSKLLGPASWESIVDEALAPTPHELIAFADFDNTLGDDMLVWLLELAKKSMPDGRPVWRVIEKR